MTLVLIQYDPILCTKIDTVWTSPSIGSHNKKQHAATNTTTTPANKKRSAPSQIGSEIHPDASFSIKKATFFRAVCDIQDEVALLRAEKTKLELELVGSKDALTKALQDLAKIQHERNLAHEWARMSAKH